MLRIPPSLLTDVIVIQPDTQTGMGIVIDEDDPVTIKARVSREAKWSVQRDGALIKDIVNVTANTWLPVGTLIELSDGERVEVKSTTHIRMGRLRVGFHMVCW